MKALKNLLPLLLTGTLAIPHAVAQPRFCIGGDLDHMTEAQKATCSAALGSVRALAAATPTSSDWHFVVVCGEEGWAQYAAFAGASGVDVLDSFAYTDVAQHETFLRAGSSSTQGEAALRAVVQKELRLIQAHASDTGASPLTAAGSDAGAPKQHARQGS